MLTPKSLSKILTPPYFFQPYQIVKRLKLESFFRSSKRAAIIRLPWKLPIKIDPHEAVGYDIASQGLYELGVTETLWRLTNRGDLVIDAGANIGYSASILGVRVGPRGRVICFEPNPEVFQSLRENVEHWRMDGRCGFFDLRMAGLGKTAGVAQLCMNDYYLTNRGTAWVSESPDDTNIRVVDVVLQSLDDVIDSGETVGVLKIDVEGYELNVLQGSDRMLRQGRIRDIVFEEENHFPAATHSYLRSLGYSLFGISEYFSGVHLLPDQAPHRGTFGPIPNYLATIDPQRALDRMQPAVWRSFGFARRFLSLEDQPQPLGRG